ncbi:MAG: T9SS type A sorting domain-containing protein [Candidatus Delongbacteria bacterium]|nr:T9SS type A sorting domain-containing protein [Candidatus Delongbacteria bacterium]
MAAPYLQYWWIEEFGPDALGTYAGRSYWLCTYNWQNQNYPIDTKVYNQSGGFSNGYVPMFIIVGYKNKVYWNHNSDGFRGALRLAIDEIVAEGVWVKNPIADKVIMFDEFQEIDISEVFADIDSNPITVSIESNGNPDIVSAGLSGNILTITANGSLSGTSTIVLKGTAREFDEIDQFDISVFDPTLYNIEDFETGDFSLIPWTFGGNANWTIDTSSPFEGIYCARSEDISDNQRADMLVSMDYVVPGNISFQYKISSEGNYDYLKFYIDGIERGKWSGATSWLEVSYPVEAGLHDFNWSYQKDGSASSYSDCAWVDRIVFEGSMLTGISNEIIPLSVNLYQNYPNPFNPNTQITFSLEKTEHVKLSVFNHSGQLVSNLIDGVMGKGIHSIDFSASNLNSGIYYYKLETREISTTRKMILIK